MITDGGQIKSNTMKPGTTVTQIDSPELKGKIVNIEHSDEGTLYVLDNGCRYLKSELQ